MTEPREPQSSKRLPSPFPGKTGEHPPPYQGGGGDKGRVFLLSAKRSGKSPPCQKKKGKKRKGESIININEDIIAPRWMWQGGGRGENQPSNCSPEGKKPGRGRFEKKQTEAAGPNRALQHGRKESQKPAVWGGGRKKENRQPQKEREGGARRKRRHIHFFRGGKKERGGLPFPPPKKLMKSKSF